MIRTPWRPAAGIAAPLLALAVAWPAVAAGPQPAPFAAGDPQAGKALVEASCVDCHARHFGGRAEQMYLRPDHKVRTPEQLLAQVRVCNAQLGTKYFPEEEEHIAAYLNQQYYKFTP